MTPQPMTGTPASLACTTEDTFTSSSAVPVPASADPGEDRDSLSPSGPPDGGTSEDSHGDTATGDTARDSKPSHPRDKDRDKGQPRDTPARDKDRDRDTARDRDSRTVPSWPLYLLAVPAGVAVWSGWVGLGQMTGFGKVVPLPGIADHFTLNTSITLPIGVEAYGAYALRAWLSKQPLSRSTRRFAAISAVGSLLLGAIGQVTYHLLTVKHRHAAPWWITTGVACLPVLVLGMGAALAHLLHRDAHGTAERDSNRDMSPVPQGSEGQPEGHGEGQPEGHGEGQPVGHEPLSRDSREDKDRDKGQSGDTPARDSGGHVGDSDERLADSGLGDRDTDSGDSGAAVVTLRRDNRPRRPRSRPVKPIGDGGKEDKLALARKAAQELADEGRDLSRANLREKGLTGNNAVLADLVRQLRAEGF